MVRRPTRDRGIKCPSVCPSVRPPVCHTAAVACCNLYKLSSSCSLEAPHQSATQGITKYVMDHTKAKLADMQQKVKEDISFQMKIQSIT